jgi:putative phosphoesterase
VKYVLLADLHGNYRALEQILNHPEVRGIDKFIIAGDIIGGAFPDKVINRIRELDALIVYGNSEEYLFKHLANDKLFESLQWAPILQTFAALSEDDIQFLSDLPAKISIKPNGHEILISHAVPDLPWEVFHPEKNIHRVRNILENIEADYLITAHSHIQWKYRWNDSCGINPGSVAYPIGYSGKTDFAIMTVEESLTVDFYSLDFDLESYINELEESGYIYNSGPMGKATIHMMRTGLTIPSLFINHIREKHNLLEHEIITDEMIHSGAKTFDWSKYDTQ